MQWFPEFMKYVLFVLLVLLVRHAEAQYNDSVHHYVNFNSTGIINKTNDGNSYVLNNNFRFNIEKKRISLNTINSWIYGKQLGALTNNDYSAGVDFNVYERKEPRRLYVWALVHYESSLSLKIHHRLQTGVGIGHHVVNKPNAVVILSDGILFEKNDLYRSAEVQTPEYQTYRNSFRVKFKWLIKKTIAFEGSDFVQHSFSDTHDYIIKSTTGLSIKLVKWLNFTTALTYNKISLSKRENLLLNFGLSAEKYF